MPNISKMKSLNLSGSQAEIVVKSLNERLYELDEELDVLESRIIEIRMKKGQLNNLLVELGGKPTGGGAPKKRGRKPGSGKKAAAKATDAAPKKRGRKPGSGKKAAAKATDAAPKKRGRKPGSGKKAAAKTTASAAPKKRGRKPGSGKKAAAKTTVSVAPKKRGPKPGKKAAAKKVAAPKKRGRKPSAGKKAVETKVAAIAPVAPKKAAKAAKKAAAPKAAPKTAAPKVAAKAVAKKEAPAPAPATKAAAKVDAKRGRKSGGENTLASKIVNSITDAKRGLSTREIVDAINTKYGAEKDERKLIQAISSTLISLTKRGKIKRENTSDGQILNNVVS